jgi:exo-beta-1,3-glucanase (GH17 family)
MPHRLSLVLAFVLLVSGSARAQPPRFPLFDVLTGSPVPTLIAYTPAELDPRQEANQRRLPTRSIRADLEALRPAFDGLVLYGYHEACTPRILAVAKELKYRVVILGIWDPKSAAECDGVAELARLYEKDFGVGILVGNEGVTFKRYEIEDVKIAAARLRAKLPATIPLGTSEPTAAYKNEFFLTFGDFLAPNIHPFFDRPNLGAADAVAWTREQAMDLARKSKVPVILKETGFPHGVKEPHSPQTQKAFWEAYTKAGLLAKVPDAPGSWLFTGVGFEAFDLPWKAEESKLPVEKAWGLLSPKREPYPALGVWRGLREAADKGGK